MLLITLLALTFKHWQANLEHVMIEFVDVMNEIFTDEKITNDECLWSVEGIDRVRKGLKIIWCLIVKEYDDSSNRDEEIEWISDAIDYESHKRHYLYRMVSLQLFGRPSKGLQTEILMEIFSMPTLLLFSHINHLKRMQIIKKLWLWLWMCVVIKNDPMQWILKKLCLKLSTKENISSSRK